MAHTLPRILIIDDIFGSSLMDRRNLSRNFALIDVTGDDDKPAPLQEPVAEAVFCSGQTRKGKFVANDVSIAIEAVKRGWGEGRGWEEGIDGRWGVILLDLR